jgi:hypothetical protein
MVHLGPGLVKYIVYTPKRKYGVAGLCRGDAPSASRAGGGKTRLNGTANPTEKSRHPAAGAAAPAPRPRRKPGVRARAARPETGRGGDGDGRGAGLGGLPRVRCRYSGLADFIPKAF